MRIAFKINLLTIFIGILALSSGSALAANTLPSASSAPAITASSSPSPTPPTPADPKIAGAEGSGNALNTLESKVPDSVKEIVKHLDKTTEDVTLDDLNSARQAIAKIEALIEIEKHLAELEKVRQERDKKISFAGAIPASALQPPSAPSSLSFGNQAPMPMVERPLEVSRIMGRNGHYSAVMKMSDEKTRTVEVGEHLPDGSTVLAISATEVDIERGHVRQSLHIKNVDTVFGNSL